MKKLIAIYFIFLLLTSCNRVSNLDSVGKNEKLNIAINEFVDKVQQQNSDDRQKAIYIAGTKKNDSIYQISAYNHRPTLYTDKTAKFLNKNFEEASLGFFRYKGFDFFVDQDLKGLFELKYEKVKDIKSKLNIENMPYPTDYPTMWINLNTKSNKISYAIPFAKIDWTEK